MNSTTKYSPSLIFKEQLKGLAPDVQDRAIKAAHRLARWIHHMQDYQCNVRVMNVQVVTKTKVRLVFKYTSEKDVLVAKKILFK